MGLKILSIALFLGFIIVTAVWIFDSVNYGEMLVFSRDKKPVVTEVKDELFGTVVQKTEYKAGFWLGLMPGDDSISLKALVGAIPMGGGFLTLGLLALFIDRRIKKKKMGDKK
jgi:hypothetical protein